MTGMLSKSDIDKHVGKQLKSRRVALHKTLSDIAKMVGVSFQQVQKYEKGTNSTSSSMLFLLAHALSVSPNYFFDNLPAPKLD